ncbi:Arm DNA-binding domain-containing protein [uncultured Thiothrix sp.]|uniref:Arm DNA-binding domain-containing protein n=1 Tax=uncultured Thiothrix sp. TaxID=223185 RepID=UPI00260E8EC1|nr:Arm DNA-binding domain-containing protein [uncultured Thiothrix sp.]HMT94752.1 Arm DNA-binding domain-containing protein [Thiolinea sp.]
MPLKDTDVKAAQATDKPYKLQDEHGLYLLVKSLTDGSTTKYWCYDYSYAGKRKTLSIGTYPETNITASSR